MPHTKESRGPASPPNVQDVFLNHARRDRLQVSVRLMDGQDLDGRIKNFDRFAIIVEHDGTDHMVFKHAIASIRASRSMPNYYGVPREP